MASARDVKRRHEARLLGTPGVIGVGLGTRETGETIVVYVERVTRRIRQAVPPRLEGVDVELVAVGRFEAR